MLNRLAFLLAFLLSLAAQLGAQGVTVGPLGNSTTNPLYVNCANCTGATASTYGTAFPAAGMPIGATDGVNLQPLKVDGSLNLRVNCQVGCSGSSFADNAAFTAGTTPIAVNGFVLDDVTPNAATEDHAAAPRMSANRVPYAQLRDASGAERGANVTAANELLVNVNNAVTVATHAVTQSGTWNIATVTTVTGITNALPAGANVIGHVIADSGSTTAVTGNVATTMADGASVTLGAKTDAKSTATDTTSVTIMQVLKEISAMVQAPASTPVTNAGTFAVQIAANSSINLNQVVGTAVDVNSGNKSAGTIRVVLATDQPQLTNKLLVTPDSVALPANQSVNISQINGVTPLMGNGITGTGSPRVTVASDNTPFTVNAAQSGNWIGSLANNGAAVATNRFGTLPAIARSNLPSAYTTGRDVALTTDVSGIGIFSQLPSGFTTYAASKQGLVPAASPTDIAVLPGNATNTVIVTGVWMSCTQTTAGIIDVQLLKRSTADTSGTSSNTTVVPLDSGNAAAVSVPITYTANPTTGTLVGNVDTQKVAALAPATASPNDMYLWKPGMGQSVVLRGTAQQLAINLNGTTLTGGSCDISFMWIETLGL